MRERRNIGELGKRHKTTTKEGNPQKMAPATLPGLVSVKTTQVSRSIDGLQIRHHISDPPIIHHGNLGSDTRLTDVLRSNGSLRLHFPEHSQKTSGTSKHSTNQRTWDINLVHVLRSNKILCPDFPETSQSRPATLSDWADQADDKQSKYDILDNVFPDIIPELRESTLRLCISTIDDAIHSLRGECMCVYVCTCALNNLFQIQNE